MTRTVDVEVDEHTRVGPYSNTHGHGPVTIIGGGDCDQKQVCVCLDCGYVTDDIRQFQHEDCYREGNPIHVTWRERLEEGVLPNGG